MEGQRRRGMAMSTMDDRGSRLEGAYEHLATKANVVELKAELKAEISDMKTELIKWMAGWTLGGMVGISTITITLIKFVGN